MSRHMKCQLAIKLLDFFCAGRLASMHEVADTVLARHCRGNSWLFETNFYLMCVNSKCISKEIEKFAFELCNLCWWATSVYRSLNIYFYVKTSVCPSYAKYIYRPPPLVQQTYSSSHTQTAPHTHKRQRKRNVKWRLFSICPPKCSYSIHKA